MRYVYSAVILACCVLAFYRATVVLYNTKFKNKVFGIFSALAYASSVWSLGFGIMTYTESENMFSAFRAIGTFGIVVYVICGQLIIGNISEQTKNIYVISVAEAVVGAAVIAMLAIPGNYIMIHTKRGFITEFTHVGWSVLYVGYCLAVTLIFVFITLRLLKQENYNKIKACGKNMLKLEILIGIAIIIDTFLPAFGVNLNIPASAILQFGGVEILYTAVSNFNKNIIDVDNIAKYLYQAIKIPVLVFDKGHNLKLVNPEARSFFEFPDADIDEKWAKSFWENKFGKSEESLTIEGHQSVVFDEVDKLRKRNCQLVINPIYDEYNDYLGYIMVVNDMTEKMIHENQPKKENEVKEKEKKPSDEIANVVKSFSKIKILAVDDMNLNLKVVKKLCSMYEIVCDTVLSGMEAIEKAASNEYDVILMDQMMPEMDGIEAMHRIRELGRGYEKNGPRKIVALTANIHEGAESEMLAEGFDAFLGKPLNLTAFEKVLESIN